MALLSFICVFLHSFFPPSKHVSPSYAGSHGHWGINEPEEPCLSTGGIRGRRCSSHVSTEWPVGGSALALRDLGTADRAGT